MEESIQMKKVQGGAWTWTGGAANYAADQMVWADNEITDVDLNGTQRVAMFRDDGKLYAEEVWHCCAGILFDVPTGTDLSSISDVNSVLTSGGRDVYYRGNGGNYRNDANGFLENEIVDGSGVPIGRPVQIQDKTMYDNIVAWLDSNTGDGNEVFIGLLFEQTKDVRGAGIFVKESSLDLDQVIVEGHQISSSQWDQAGGIFGHKAKVINISNSTIRHNKVQNGDGAGIGVFESQELSLTNTTVYGNDALGDNNCTAGGLGDPRFR